MYLVKTAFDILELESLERQMLLHDSEILSAQEAKYLDLYVPTGVEMKFGQVLENRKPNHVYFSGTSIPPYEKRLFFSMTLDDAVFYGKEQGSINPAVYKPELVHVAATHAMQYLGMLPTFDREDEQGNKELIADNGVAIIYSSFNHRLNPQFEGYKHWKPSFFAGIFNIDEAYAFMRMYTDIVNNAKIHLGSLNTQDTNAVLPKIKKLTRASVTMHISSHRLNRLRHTLKDKLTPGGLRILE
jgi:hypothetical protein